MWLPTPFYERAPHYWLLLGLLLIITGGYLAIEMDSMYMYLGVGVGVACCIWSLRVFKRRKQQRPAGAVDNYLDQTCELNHIPEQD